MMHGSTPDPHPLAAQRQAEIAVLLAREGRVVAGRLAKRFNVSEDTIRRDLREMAAQGRCRRVYGGALPAATDDGPMVRRAGQDRPRKTALAASIVRTILPDSCLFLNAGSTNLAVAALLPVDAGLTVVTNAPSIAALLADRVQGDSLAGSAGPTPSAGRGGCDIILIGGRLDVASGACLGPQALRDLGRFRFSALVLGACGVDALAGVTAHVFEEAELKAAAAERSASVLVGAINAKIGTAAAFHVLPATGISRLFVEADCSVPRLAPFEAAGIDVIRAQPPVAAEAPGLRRARRASPSARGPGDADGIADLDASTARRRARRGERLPDPASARQPSAVGHPQGGSGPDRRPSETVPLDPQGTAVPGETSS